MKGELMAKAVGEALKAKALGPKYFQRLGEKSLYKQEGETNSPWKGQEGHEGHKSDFSGWAFNVQI